jgi:S-DNA-T family DNA segregation ATPase FtsK/SpoIIIE
MGANALLGKGDLLFVPPGVSALTRIHGPFLSDEEVKRVADYCRAQGKPNYAPAIRLDDSDGGDEEIEELDEEMSRYYDEILDIALEKGQISTSMIQRHLKLGYNRACTLMEQLERNGIVGPADGAKPRKVVAQD